MTKEMYKAQYRKEIYERTIKQFRECSHNDWPIIEVRQLEMASILFDERFCGIPEQKAALDEIEDEMSAEWEAYRAQIIDHRRRLGLVRY